MKLLPLILAVIIAAVAALFALKFVQQEDKEVEKQVVVVPQVVEKPVPTVDILVARSAIPIGTKITMELLDRQPWPKHLVLENFIVSDGANTGIMGLVTRAPFQAREPVIRSKLANPNDPSFLAASLPKGMRAVTIPTDVISGVAGFVYPGDRVDILITHQVPMGTRDPLNASSGAKMEPITELLLSNVKVIAVDQRATGGTGQGPMIPSTVTLEVSQYDAQKLRLSERDGSLSLALRALDDGDAIELARPTGISDLSRITPPTYFPVLYDTRSTYQPEIVDLFKTEEAAEMEEVKQEQQMEVQRVMSERIKQRLESRLANNSSLGSLAAKTTGSSVHTMTIVRGSEKQTVGVERP